MKKMQWFLKPLKRKGIFVRPGKMIKKKRSELVWGIN